MAKEAPPDAFGNAAREYELGRPEWPEELVDRVVDELALGANASVLDLGAGTGKLTRALVRRFPCVIAVEPDDAMRGVLQEVVPEAEALAGRGEAIPLPDSSVDAVFTAEAFHWYASDESVAEIVRVLQPRGGLAIFWNVDFGETDPAMPDGIEAVLDEAFAQGGAPGLPKVLSGLWRQPIEAAPFEPLQKLEIERTVESDSERWLASMLSVSSIASQSDEARSALTARLRELLPQSDYRWHVRTVVYWTRLHG